MSKLYTKSSKNIGKDDREFLGEQFNRLTKMIDAGKIVPHGRIQSYWSSKPEVNLKKYTTNVPKEMIDVYTDPEKTCKYFGLRSIEFGNWLNDNERIQFLVGIADCLYLIKRMYSLSSPKKIGKNELSISLGARGRGGKAAAHYEGGNKVINITKPHVTAGAFMHEFAHHVDFSSRIPRYGIPSGGASRSISIFEDRLKAPTPVNWFEKLFEKLYIYNNKFTDFAEQMKQDTDYMASRVEVFARTSEVYFRMKQKGTKNKIFTSSRYNYKHSEGYPTEGYVEKATMELDNIYEMYFRQ